MDSFILSYIPILQVIRTRLADMYGLEYIRYTKEYNCITDLYGWMCLYQGKIKTREDAICPPGFLSTKPHP